MLLELLGDQAAEGATGIRYEGFHDYIQFRVRGELPKDRERMLEKLDRMILEYPKERTEYSYVEGECPSLEKCGDGKEIWNMQDVIP